MNTTFVKKRMDGEPRVGRPSALPLSEASSAQQSDYITRTNELLGRVGSSVELEALLSDTPMVDVYGRTIIADKKQTPQHIYEPQARSSSSVASAGSKPSGSCSSKLNTIVIVYMH